MSLSEPLVPLISLGFTIITLISLLYQGGPLTGTVTINNRNHNHNRKIIIFVKFPPFAFYHFCFKSVSQLLTSLLCSALLLMLMHEGWSVTLALSLWASKTPTASNWKVAIVRDSIGSLRTFQEDIVRLIFRNGSSRLPTFFFTSQTATWSANCELSGTGDDLVCIIIPIALNSSSYFNSLISKRLETGNVCGRYSRCHISTLRWV